ncbi:hypothetical protein AWG79_26360 [Escherichia coli]|nr:hypothetical protein AWG79_26360 [Escherichia coli]
MIVITHIGANHHLKLPGIGETAFHHGELLNFFRSGIGRLVEDKAQASNTVAHRRNIAAPADQFNQPIDIRLVYFAHHKAPWQMTFLVGCRIYCAEKFKNGNVPETQRRSQFIVQETIRTGWRG